MTEYDPGRCKHTKAGKLSKSAWGNARCPGKRVPGTAGCMQHQPPCSLIDYSTGKQCVRPSVPGVQEWVGSRFGWEHLEDNVRFSSICNIHGAWKYGSLIRHSAFVQRETVREAMRQYGVPVEIDPHVALLEEVRRCAGHVAWLNDKISQLADDDLTQPGFAVVNPKTGEVHVVSKQASVWVKLYQEERSALVRVAKVAIDAGVEERRVRIAESQGELIARVISGVLADLNVVRTPEVSMVVRRHLVALAAEASA